MSPNLDTLRAAYPHLSFCLYAFAGQRVKLECINAQGDIFPFEGDTEAAAIHAGFPELEPAPATELAPPATSVFD